jgi:hypothetical protein
MPVPLLRQQANINPTRVGSIKLADPRPPFVILRTNRERTRRAGSWRFCRSDFAITGPQRGFNVTIDQAFERPPSESSNYFS